jgi:hypothetical protein
MGAGSTYISSTLRRDANLPTWITVVTLTTGSTVEADVDEELEADEVDVDVDDVDGDEAEADVDVDEVEVDVDEVEVEEVDDRTVLGWELIHDVKSFQLTVFSM